MSCVVKIPMITVSDYTLKVSHVLHGCQLNMIGVILIATMYIHNNVRSACTDIHTYTPSEHTMAWYLYVCQQMQTALNRPCLKLTYSLIINRIRG